MAPKSPEKQQQQQAAVAVKHSNPFYISAHRLCHNRRLRNKRSKYSELIKKAILHGQNFANHQQQARKKTDVRKEKLNSLKPDVTIDLLSDDENTMQKTSVLSPQKSMCVERAALLGLMPVDKSSAAPAVLKSIPAHKSQKNNLQQAAQQRKAQRNNQQQKQSKNSQQSLSRQQQQHLLLQQQHINNIMLLQQQILLQQQEQLQLSNQAVDPKIIPAARKRKSKPQKRRSLPPPVILNNESIVLSDDSDIEMQTSVIAANKINLSGIQPDVSIIYSPPSPSKNNNSACLTTSLPLSQVQQQQRCNNLVISNIQSSAPTLAATSTVFQATPPQLPPPPPPSLPIIPQQTMAVDEEVTISLVPRSLTATKCATRTAITNASNGPTSSTTNPNQVFPMLPDETTVHTVIANRIYELSLTKLREGLACGIPEFADGPQKISPQRRKNAVHIAPQLTQPQAPISLKLSSDLSISLISDDDDDDQHQRTYQKYQNYHQNIQQQQYHKQNNNINHKRKNQNDLIISPELLQKLPVNVSIAPVPRHMVPGVMLPAQQATQLVEPRKLKLG